MSHTDTTTPPRIYVSTYAKYNSGSLAGAWLCLEDYSDAGTFGEACAALHADEAYPEYMFQDSEGIPAGMVSESCLSDEFWAWMYLDDDDKQLLSVYREHVEQSGDIEAARDAFMGKADTAAGWAEDYLTETGALAEVPQDLRNYIDYEAYARDARHGGMTFAKVGYHAVWVFSA